MDILGVLDLFTVLLYFGIGLIPLLVIGVIVAYLKFTVNCTVFSGDNIEHGARVWQPKDGVITIGKNTWNVSNVKPVSHAGRFGYEPKYYLSPDNAIPLEVDKTGFRSHIPTASEFQKIIKQEVMKALMTPQSDMKSQLLFMLVAFVAGACISYGLGASGVIPMGAPAVK